MRNKEQIIIKNSKKNYNINYKIYNLKKKKFLNFKKLQKNQLKKLRIFSNFCEIYYYKLIILDYYYLKLTLKYK